MDYPTFPGMARHGSHYRFVVSLPLPEAAAVAAEAATRSDAEARGVAPTEVVRVRIREWRRARERATDAG